MSCWTKLSVSCCLPCILHEILQRFALQNDSKKTKRNRSKNFFIVFFQNLCNFMRQQCGKTMNYYVETWFGQLESPCVFCRFTLCILWIFSIPNCIRRTRIGMSEMLYWINPVFHWKTYETVVGKNHEKHLEDPTKPCRRTQDADAWRSGASILKFGNDTTDTLRPPSFRSPCSGRCLGDGCGLGPSCWW